MAIIVIRCKFDIIPRGRILHDVRGIIKSKHRIEEFNFRQTSFTRL